jgi:hypothetical protein
VFIYRTYKLADGAPLVYTLLGLTKTSISTVVRIKVLMDEGSSRESPKGSGSRPPYLCLESVLDDLDPIAKLIQKKGGGMRTRGETEWLADALGGAYSKYSLDLRAFSANPLDARDTWSYWVLTVISTRRFF